MRADHGIVDGAAFLRGIEVDDVQPAALPGAPVLRHRDGVDAVHGLARVVALLELDALAAADVDGWKDVHGVAVYSRRFVVALPSSVLAVGGRASQNQTTIGVGDR